MTTLYSRDADLYDIAFDWDVGKEVEWLLARLGEHCRTLLEPGCGSGRILEAFARRGLAVVGLDRSAEMIEAARQRLATAGLRGRVVLGDIASFDLGESFDGAVCPISTLKHLDPEDLGRHFQCMARHLAPGARYLVQVAHVEPGATAADLPANSWEAERGDTRMRVTWWVEEIDLERQVERNRTRIEILTGARAGEVVEEEHLMTPWTPGSWRAQVESSPFTQVATYDGNERARPAVGPNATGGLLWHELVVEG